MLKKKRYNLMVNNNIYCMDRQGEKKGFSKESKHDKKNNSENTFLRVWLQAIHNHVYQTRRKNSKFSLKSTNSKRNSACTDSERLQAIFSSEAGYVKVDFFRLTAIGLCLSVCTLSYHLTFFVCVYVCVCYLCTTCIYMYKCPPDALLLSIHICTH